MFPLQELCGFSEDINSVCFFHTNVDITDDHFVWGGNGLSGLVDQLHDLFATIAQQDAFFCQLDPAGAFGGANQQLLVQFFQDTGSRRAMPFGKHAAKQPLWICSVSEQPPENIAEHIIPLQSPLIHPIIILG